MGYRGYATANGHIVATDGTGDFTTIGAALTAASSGQTIFIRPGTYTENPTLKSGVNLCAFDCDALTPNVIISGKCTFTAAGTVSISGIQLETNSDYALSVTGSAASIVNFINCYINVSNNTGIQFTSSSSSSQINFRYSTANVTTTGISLFTHSSAGLLSANFTNFGNPGSTTTPSTISSGNLQLAFGAMQVPITASSTAIISCEYTNFNTVTNTTCITLSGTSSALLDNSDFISGSSSALSIGSGTTVTCQGPITINCTGTFGISGSGSISYTAIFYNNSTSNIESTVTQTPVNQQRIGGSISTMPVQSQPSSLSLGSAYQYGVYDVVLTIYLSVTAATSASILCGVGPTTTPTQQTIISGLTVASQQIIPITVYLPASYYCLLSVSGTITETISGQQATPV
jgi:hypothetical protein